MKHETRTAVSIRDQIMMEIQEQVATHGEIAVPLYFNNFFIKLPSSGEHDFINRFKGKHLSTRYIDMLVEILRKPIEEVEAESLDMGKSAKYLSNTPAEFICAITEAIDLSGVNREALKAYVDERFENRTMTLEEMAPFDQRLLLPVWIKLREMGYSDQDLRG